MLPKLVRDRVPEIMRESGVEPELRVITGEENRAELMRFLHEKLLEEAGEVASADTREKLKEEAADLLEVLDTLLRLDNLDRVDDVTPVQTRKRVERGGFDGSIVLVGWKERDQ